LIENTLSIIIIYSANATKPPLAFETHPDLNHNIDHR